MKRPPVIGEVSRLHSLLFSKGGSMKKVAILVDGGFYRKVARHLCGEKTPEERVDELVRYCRLHLKDRDVYIKKGDKKIYQYNDLYRIFYYDCAPIDKTLYNPLTQKNFNFSKSNTYIWMTRFLNNLKQRRKLALRMGFFADEEMNYIFSADTVKKLCKKSITIDDSQESDLV